MADRDEYDDYLDRLDRRSLELAMTWALAQRNFEIELYWKRVAYFWAFVAVAFAGYFTIVRDSATNTPTNAFIVSCLGALFTLTWYWASRGSSFWHLTWDLQVKRLSSRLVGPLFHGQLKDARALRLGPLRVSLTALNELLSLYVFGIWTFLAVRALSEHFRIPEPFPGFNFVVIALWSSLFILATLPVVVQWLRRHELLLEFDKHTPRHSEVMSR